MKGGAGVLATGRSALLAVATVWAVLLGLATAAAAAPPGRGGPVLAPASPVSIPVIDWHELNNGCASTAVVCNAADPESVSTTQLANELNVLKAANDHTITPAQYEAWVEGVPVTLPTNPVLLIADNGIENFLAGAQSLLKADGFTLTVAVITGFADGASGICTEPKFEAGCPAANEDGGWDATWSQLEALPSAQFNFILEAGTAGHFVQTYDPSCTAFYACTVPGESTSAYESRVATDLYNGATEAGWKLGSQRFTSALWVVPYSDDGYTACGGADCTPQPYDGPAGWLTNWTASTFPVAFVEDASRNGLQHERFRLDVQGWMTAPEFASQLSSDLSAGDFTRLNTPPPAQLPPPPPPPTTSTTPVTALPVVSLDSDSMSTAQVVAELAYLRSKGFNTVSAESYVTWAAEETVALPPNPILLTVTGNNSALIAAVSPYLISDGDSAVDFVNTGAIDSGAGATTWAQLAALPPAAWQFSFSAGAAGGSLVAADPTSCDVYYACAAPGESTTAYEARVNNDVGTGRLELDNSLWMQTVDDALWSAPFGDAGQSGQESNGPSGWLSQWAANVFGVVLVPSGANGQNEHDALSVSGSTSEAQFESALSAGLADGMFNG